MKSLAILARAETHGDAISVRTATSVHTYHELVANSAVLAEALLESRCDLDETRVAFLAPAGADYVTMQWAIWRAGGIAVPLSLSATLPELRYTLSDCQAEGLITTRDRVDELLPLTQPLGIRLVDASSVTDNVLVSFLPRTSHVRTVRSAPTETRRFSPGTNRRARITSV